MILRNENSPSLHWKLAILGAAVVFVFLAASNIDLPGLYYDELIQVTPALSFVKGPLQVQVFGEAGTEIGFHGHRLSWMTMGYLGALKTIVFVPIAAALHLGPKSVRYFTIMIGALALIAISAFARRFLGPMAAALGAFLLATDPSYLIYCRTDYGPTVLMMLLKGVALWQLLVWWQTRNSWSLYRAAFAMGLGLYDKTNFLWIVIAIAGAVLMVAPRSFTRLTRQEVMRAGCLFIVGCLPLIVYNRHWPPPTWTALKTQNMMARRGETGAPRSFPELEHRLMQRARVLNNLFTASTVNYVRGYLAPRLAPMSVVFFVASVITVICYMLRRLRRRWRGEMLLLLATFLIILFAAVTPGAYEGHHLILSYPFPHLLVAAIAIRCMRLCSQMRKPLGTIAAGAVFLAGVAGPVTGSTLRYRQVMVQLQKTGGTGSWSDGIYALDSWLEQYDSAQPVVAVDWGIGQPLAVLSQGRLHCVELWSVHDAAGYQGLFNGPGSRYVLHPPDGTHFPKARDIFLEAVRVRGLQIHLVKTITDRMGHPVLLVYVLSRNIGSEPLSERQGTAR